MIYSLNGKVLHMPKTKVYEPEFKKKIVRLYLEEGRTIKSLNEEYPLGILRNFMKRTRNYGRNWNNRKKEIAS